MNSLTYKKQKLIYETGSLKEIGNIQYPVWGNKTNQSAALSKQHFLKTLSILWVGKEKYS